MIIVTLERWGHGTLIWSRTILLLINLYYNDYPLTYLYSTVFPPLNLFVQYRFPLKPSTILYYSAPVPCRASCTASL
jgi:hypothetical protein